MKHAADRATTAFFSLTHTPSHRIAANAELHQVRQHAKTVQLRRVGDAVLREAEAHQRRRRRRKPRRERPQPVVLQAELAEVAQAAEKRRGAQLAYFIAVEVDLHESAAAVKPSQVPDAVTLEDEKLLRDVVLYVSCFPFD